ncbi:MAG: O-methyltransferase [Actinomycetes bacterium]
MRTARAKAIDLGSDAISPATAALLSVLAASVDAAAVVEIGASTGVSGAALLSGMTEEGVLTSIDVEAENQRVARDTFTALGYDHVRTRLITGRALEVLPRLQDSAYDIVFVNGDRTEYPAIVTQARRLLRSGGLIVLNSALGTGGLADAGQREAGPAALREAANTLRDEDHWLPALLTVGSGLLIATLRAAE